MRRLIFGFTLLSLAIFLPGCAADEGLDVNTAVPATSSPTLIFFYTEN
jgi:hypothetical protein